MSQSAAGAGEGGAHPKIPLVLVVAVAENGVIGRNNAIPWRLKTDLAHFRAVTIGRPVIMGRKTYVSIGKPLKARTNIVVSRDPKFCGPGVVAAVNLVTALTIARADALRRGADSIAVIGGTEVFRETLPIADRLDFTRVHLRPDGDVLFPDYDPSEWQEVSRSAHPAGPQDEASFDFILYERRAAASVGAAPA